MTSQVLGWLLLGAALLVCLGLLLEAWTNHALESGLHQRAEERRRLNEEWVALRAAHRQQDQDPADDDLHGGVAVVDPSDSPALSSAKTSSGPISTGTAGALLTLLWVLLILLWVAIHDRPGSGGQRPPRVRSAMAMSESGLW